MDDLISRSALVVELENRMITAGDPVIRMIFARFIDIVKDQPKVADPIPVRFETGPQGFTFHYSDGRTTEIRF